MALICLTSAKHSPGVTTTALALAENWPRPVLLAECDPRFSDIQAGYQQAGGNMVCSLLGLAAAAAAQPTELGFLLPYHVQRLVRGSGYLMTGIQFPIQAGGVSGLWEPLSRIFPNLQLGAEPTDVVADLGQLGLAHSPMPLLARSDLTLLVTGDRVEHLRAAQYWVEHLISAMSHVPYPHRRLAAVVVAPPRDRRHSARQIASALGIDVALEIDNDSDVAARLLSGRGLPPRAEKSAYLRTMRAFAQTIVERVGPQRPVQGPATHGVGALLGERGPGHGR